MKKIKVASRRIKRDWAMCALSLTMYKRDGQNEPRRRHTKEEDRSRESGDDSRIPTLLHDSINNRDRQTAKDRRECAHADIWNVVRGVAIANVVEVEVSIEAYKPASQT